MSRLIMFDSRIEDWKIKVAFRGFDNYDKMMDFYNKYAEELHNKGYLIGILSTEGNKLVCEIEPLEPKEFGKMEEIRIDLMARRVGTRTGHILLKDRSML